MACQVDYARGIKKIPTVKKCIAKYFQSGIVSEVRWPCGWGWPAAPKEEHNGFGDNSGYRFVDHQGDVRQPGQSAIGESDPRRPGDRQ